MQQHTAIEKLYAHYLTSGQKICTDTRKIEKDSLFFALKGDHFNANEFAAKAIEQGCSFAIIDEEKYHVLPQTILVENVLQTLQQLANYHRKQLRIPFLAITGSNGKTTTKELVATVLSKKYDTLATFGNLNNHIGVPLTILSITSQHQFAIIEMGANHQGEIDELCRIAEPDFGLITNIGKAHLEGFGGIEGVKKGKSEMYRFINSHRGRLFVNADDEVLMDLSSGIAKTTYSMHQNSDVLAKDITNSETVSFQFKNSNDTTPWSNLENIHTHIIGHYNLVNCLAACCIGTYFEVPKQHIIDALANYHPNMNRSQLVKTKSNTVILDAYNANPNSTRVAIDNFAKLTANHKVLCLGDMFELGEYAEAEHQAIVNLLIQKNFQHVILVGPNFQKTSGHSFTKLESTKQCIELIKTMHLQNSHILIKGSRGMKMESLVEYL